MPIRLSFSMDIEALIVGKDAETIKTLPPSTRVKIDKQAIRCIYLKMKEDSEKNYGYPVNTEEIAGQINISGKSLRNLIAQKCFYTTVTIEAAQKIVRIAKEIAEGDCKILRELQTEVKEMITQIGKHDEKKTKVDKEELRRKVEKIQQKHNGEIGVAAIARYIGETPARFHELLSGSHNRRYLSVEKQEKLKKLLRGGVSPVEIKEKAEEQKASYFREDRTKIRVSELKKTVEKIQQKYPQLKNLTNIGRYLGDPEPGNFYLSLSPGRKYTFIGKKNLEKLKNLEKSLINQPAVQGEISIRHDKLTPCKSQFKQMLSYIMLAGLSVKAISKLIKIPYGRLIGLREDTGKTAYITTSEVKKLFELAAQINKKRESKTAFLRRVKIHLHKKQK